MKSIEPRIMWAAISVVGPKQYSRWIHANTIRRTRKEAKAAYLEGWADREVALTYVTFERVHVYGTSGRSE